MTVRRLLKGKGSFVPVIRSDLTLNDVVSQLDLDDVGALVVTDDEENSWDHNRAGHRAWP